MLYPLANFKQVNWQGVNGTIYALLALDSKNYEIPKTYRRRFGKRAGADDKGKADSTDTG